ncbi:MAG: transcription antitermination factor NusB [Gemmataceae bacterium]|nr:transcription antitermination factor NusB [Gemmataceae bacterium]
MTRRTRAREVALQLLFQRDLQPGVTRLQVDAFAKERLSDEPSVAFCIKLYDGVIERQAEIDQRLAGAAENWRVSRMAAVDRNLLRLSAFELLYDPETPAPVVIDEAVELARRFGAGESSAFVNGILDRLKRDAAPAPAPTE